MPDAGGRDAVALCQDGFDEGSCEGLRRFEAGKMWEDVWMGLLGVAYPAWACGCKDRFLRLRIHRTFCACSSSGRVSERGIDFLGRGYEGRRAQGVCVDDPGEAVSIQAARPKACRSPEEVRNHVTSFALADVVGGGYTGSNLRANAGDEDLAS